MTSMASESVSTILVSCRQTRFHIESPNYRELDIEGLSITVTSGEKAAGKGKARAKADGTEVLSDADLRLKAGRRYALIGRNGSGKSTLLQAIAEKLIPGIPEGTRVSILQQTDEGDATTDDAQPGDPEPGSSSSPGATVLESIVDKATSRSELDQEIKILSDGLGSADPLGALRSLRKIRHDRLQKRLFVLDKDARLRSGARGLQARKALKEFEKIVGESEAMINQADDEIAAETVQKGTQEAAELLAGLQLQIDPSRLAEVESRARKILAGLGFGKAYVSRPVASLSGGWRMRTALAAALLQDADILILDEPTNFLDLLSIMWLQSYLQSLGDATAEPPTLVLVSHDRDFVSVATDLLILEGKTLSCFHGDLPTYEASQSERRLYLTKMKEAQDKQKAHIRETIARNIKQGREKDDDNKLRQAKSRQKKLDDRWGMQVSAKGTRFKLNRDLAGYHVSSRAEIDVPAAARAVAVALPEPPELRFPGALLSLEAATFRHAGAAAPTLRGVGLSVHAGDRVGVLGLNGAGKSTLAALLTGAARPASGAAAAHPRLRLAHYAQHAVDALRARGAAEPGLTALGVLAREAAGAGEGEGEGEGALRAALAALGLRGRLAAEVPVRRLSGGQLARCELARLLWRRPQVLVLDEVTTHLDYETVAALRAALRGWAGAVVLVSHDRWFVRGVVEGEADDGAEGSGDEGGGEAGRAAGRRRVVYRLEGGGLTELQGGVQEFEDSLQRRVRKMLRDEGSASTLSLRRR